MFRSVEASILEHPKLYTRRMIFHNPNRFFSHRKYSFDNTKVDLRRSFRFKTLKTLAYTILQVHHENLATDVHIMKNKSIKDIKVTRG